MELYLVQHAASKSEQEDPTRPLTEDGATAIARMADFAKAVRIHVVEIWHSGKLRAVQSAEALAKTLTPVNGVWQMAGLNPMDDVKPIAQRLTQQSNDLMLVGHLPHLSKLASYLLCGDEERTIIQFQMGGIVHLSQPEKRQWTLARMITPDILPE